MVPRFDKAAIKAICDEMNAMMEEVERLDTAIPLATGTARNAYLMTHKDLLWKIQRKMGEMWFMLGNAKPLINSVETE